MGHSESFVSVEVKKWEDWLKETGKMYDEAIKNSNVDITEWSSISDKLQKWVITFNSLKDEIANMSYKNPWLTLKWEHFTDRWDFDIREKDFDNFVKWKVNNLNIAAKNYVDWVKWALAILEKEIESISTKEAILNELNPKKLSFAENFIKTLNNRNDTINTAAWGPQ